MRYKLDRYIFVSKTLFWLEWLSAVFPLSTKARSSRLALSLKQRRKLRRWLFSLSTMAAMCWWNWKIFLATAIGISLMLLVYSAQQGNWQQYWRKLRYSLTGSNLKLAIAVFSGGIGGFGTYLAASIWTDSENRWLATGSMLQGFASLLTLLLLAGNWWQGTERASQGKFERLLSDLSDREALKKLIAIRQLTSWVINDRLNRERRWQLIEYYRLMLSQPQIPTIQNALWEALTQLGVRQQDIEREQPREIPIPLQPSPQPLYQGISNK